MKSASSCHGYIRMLSRRTIPGACSETGNFLPEGMRHPIWKPALLRLSVSGMEWRKNYLELKAERGIDGIVRYVERWSQMMEQEIKDGASVAEAAERTQSFGGYGWHHRLYVRAGGQSAV